MRTSLGLIVGAVFGNDADGDDPARISRLGASTHVEHLGTQRRP
ncbi:MAG: hypothetical protein JWL71_4816 [Acidobacteria bacterium]|nr:hypothetical protein [Acidobacteriota bacterium]